jgi:hypothetical protein
VGFIPKTSIWGSIFKKKYETLNNPGRGCENSSDQHGGRKKFRSNLDVHQEEPQAKSDKVVSQENFLCIRTPLRKIPQKVKETGGNFLHVYCVLHL